MKLVRSKPAQPAASRAETARQRRSQTSQQRTTRVTRNLVKPAARAPQPPPVTVRGQRTSAAAPVRTKGRGTPRRQYYLTDATGVEVRLPSVPMIHPGWRLLSGTLVLVLAFFIYLAYNDSHFQVSTVEITGLKRLKAAQITELLDLNNTPIFMVNPEEVRSLLAISFPELTDVKMIAGLPAELTITVTERQPVMSWKVGERIYWVDKTGYIFPARGEAAKLVQVEADSEPPVLVTDIPLTEEEQRKADALREEKKTQDIVGKTLDPTMLKAVLALGKKVEGAPLVYTIKDGLGWSDPAGWTAFVGMDLNNINLKLKVYQAVVKKLSDDGITPVMISVENVNAPFYRLEQ